ncbi:hypothetical protein TRFO_06890 [Tritrichomonas foetus]|uniref:Uncharacterized protein n=1 Tax=Tritrichomonas foetus TaxID=1144522 RepID=A0A1J4JWM8_9EUKA|nr:hypothetical protein TRFO_06890 [Tritrichomonas foetus]|eukprot:OHT02856.1 hypothetical protein TRFO_06890 [Tritrichomonas foetus]
MDSQKQGNQSQGGPRRGGFRGGRGNRGRGGENHQENRGRGGARGGRGGQGGERRPADRTQMPRRPRMFPKNDIKDIKLNPIQAEQIKELDEKLRAIGKPVPPNQEEYKTKIKVFEDKISEIFDRIKTYHESINEQQNLRKKFFEDNNSGDNVDNAQFNELLNKKKALMTQRKATDDLRTATHQKIQSLKDKTGFSNYDAALVRIDEIDDRIGSATLNNNELKKLLGERDRIAKEAPALQQIEPLQKQLQESREKLNGIYEEINKINKEIDDFREKRNNAFETRKSLKNESQKFYDQIEIFRGKIAELKKEVEAKKEEKQTFQNAFNKQFDEYRKKLQEKSDLEYQRNVIYCEAERIMNQVRQGLAKIGEIREKVNPHQKEIQDASSLVQYLEHLQDSAEQKEAESKVVHGKAEDQKILDLIASCKATKKAKRQQKEQPKPKAQTITHSLQTVAQFGDLNLTAPTKIEEIPELVKKLREMIKGWEATFIKANVAFNVKEDGSVAVSIRLA